MSGRPPVPVKFKTFGEYMRQVRAKETWGVGLNEPNFEDDYELLDRLRHGEPAAADEIDSLPKLQTWARLRWPDWYTCRSGEANDGPTGKQVMAYLWADYLSWAEAAS